MLRPVKKLIRYQKLSRPQIFLERAHRAHGDDAFHAEQLHRIHIRPVIDLARQDAVPAAVPRQECHALPFQCAEHNRIRRIPKRRPHANFPLVRQAAHRIKPAPSNDSNGCLAMGPGTPRLTRLLRRHLLFLRFFQTSRPLFFRISFTAVNGSFLRFATSAASSARRDSPPAPPRMRSSKRDSSSSIKRFFQSSTCFRCRSPLDSKSFQTFPPVSPTPSFPSFSFATVRPTPGAQPYPRSPRPCMT